ncbi:MAG: C40 family peptidase [Duncaniella sp.]|nr:C40 family peptidase [Duncaniella sp.]
MTRRLLLPLLILSVLSVLVGCKSSRHATTHARWEQKAPHKETKKPKLPKPDRDKPDGKLIAEAESWLGVPYKYGGNDRSGVDCSGLVLQVYLRALEIPLPRNSKAQWEYCKLTKLSEIRPGDLLFFATGKDKKRVSHVGIYVGDNQMIHSSTRQGVVVADITSSYFEQTFIDAGYVDGYRKMLSDKKKPKEKKHKEEKPKDDKPQPTVSAVSDTPATPMATVPPVTPVTPVTSAPSTDEPTPEDARNYVLSNLIEKKHNSQE